MASLEGINPVSQPLPGADMVHDFLDVVRDTNEDRYGRFLATSDAVLFRGYERSPAYQVYEELVIMRSGFSTLTPSEEQRTFRDLRTTAVQAALRRAITSAGVTIDELAAITHDTIDAIKVIHGTRRLHWRPRHQLYGITYELSPISDTQLANRSAEVRNNLPYSLWNGVDATALANSSHAYFL